MYYATYSTISCFLIDADTTNPNRVIGYVVVNPDFPLLIDYEEYEVIYLYVTVTDHRQVINDHSTDGTCLTSDLAIRNSQSELRSIWLVSQPS